MVRIKVLLFCANGPDLNRCPPPFSFVAENWQSGWLGQFMWGVFSNQLGLKSDDIVAMTTLNFTGATSPKNKTSVYQGASSYTRCVWEVKIGNAVSAAIISCTPQKSHRAIGGRTSALPISGRRNSEEASQP
jgi:hypothetical protein